MAYKFLGIDDFAKLFKRKTRIITHGDWDGICSAAILKAFLRESLGRELKNKQIFFSRPKMLLQDKRIVKLKPSKGVGVNIPLRIWYKPNTVILDLPLMPQTTIWVDHHDANAPMGKELGSCLCYYYDPIKASTVQLLSQMLRKSFNFKVPEELVLLTNNIDAGAYGRKFELDDLDALPFLKKLCYLAEHRWNDRDLAISYRIINLVADKYTRLNGLDDSMVEARFQTLKPWIELGRQLIASAEYYHGLLIIKKYQTPEKAEVNYWDIPPIFHSHIQARDGMAGKPFLGTLLVRNEFSCRLAVPWRSNPQLFQLKKAGKLNIRPLAQKFGGDGHFNVVGFTLLGEEAIGKVKREWDAWLKRWNLE